jgi:hypothetical protein
VENVTTREFLWRLIQSSISHGYRRRRCLSRLCTLPVYVCFSRGTRFSRHRPVLHVLPANDASLVLHRLHLLPRRVRIERVHVLGSLTVATEITDLEDEGTEGEVDVTEDVERESVEGEDETEEDEVGEELEEVCGEGR